MSSLDNTRCWQCERPKERWQANVEWWCACGVSNVHWVVEDRHFEDEERLDAAWETTEAA